MGRFLQSAVESVLAQDYPEIQYIVIDGGSDDETVDILRGYGDRIQWCSEPDQGAADALSKGFAAAQGEVFGWLNADDTLMPGAVRAAVEALQERANSAGVYADGVWVNDEGRAIGRYPVQEFSRDLLARECFICQPACFFRASAYQAAGGIDARYHTVFDWDLWIRMTRQSPFARVSGDWARVVMHAATKTLGQRREVLEESAALLAYHFGYVPFQWIYARLCHEADGRDQFYAPLRPSPAAWLRALPLGLEANPQQRARYFRDWSSAFSLGGLWRQVLRISGIG
jgi:glycosyltransferase involved in cell wall biosynthesis